MAKKNVNVPNPGAISIMSTQQLHRDGGQRFTEADINVWYGAFVSSFDGRFQGRVERFLPQQAGGARYYRGFGTQALLYYARLNSQQEAEEIAQTNGISTNYSDTGQLAASLNSANGYGQHFHQNVNLALDALATGIPTRPLNLGAAVFLGMRSEYQSAGLSGQQLHNESARAFANFIVRCARPKLRDRGVEVSFRQKLDLVMQKSLPYKELAKDNLPNQSEVTKATAGVSIVDLVKLMIYMGWKGGAEKDATLFKGIAEKDREELEKQLAYLEAVIVGKLTAQLQAIRCNKKKDLPSALKAVNNVVQSVFEATLYQVATNPNTLGEEVEKIEFSKIEREQKTTGRKVKDVLGQIGQRLISGHGGTVATALAADKIADKVADAVKGVKKAKK